MSPQPPPAPRRRQRKKQRAEGGEGHAGDDDGPGSSDSSAPRPASDESDQPRSEEDVAEPKERADVVVNNGSLSELKNACDDRLQEYFASTQGYVQSHRKTDIKLLIGYTSCAIAGALSLYCYFKPLEETTLVTICGVLMYFALNSVMMFYSGYVEKSIIFEGRRTKPRSEAVEMLVVESSTGPYSPVLDLVFRTMEFSDATSRVPNAQSQLEFPVPFSSCFDEGGLFVREVFDRKMEECLEAARRAQKPTAGSGMARNKGGKTG